MTPHELFDAGRLQEAIAAATEEVRQRPADASRRRVLAELLLFVGEFERADRQFDALGHQDPDSALVANLLRQLVRAEQARQQFFREGRLPEFLEPASPWVRLHLEASILLREQKPAEAARLLSEAENQRPHVAGTCDGRAFEDLRDLDDLTSCVFEVLTSTGKYYWVPIERVDSIEFRPPQRPYELLWRRAHLVVRAGPDGEVFFPTLYPGAATEADDRLRLGHLTEWRGGEGAPIRGAGQRLYWIGGEDRPILELQSIAIERQPQPDEPPAGEPAAPIA